MFSATECCMLDFCPSLSYFATGHAFFAGGAAALGELFAAWPWARSLPCIAVACRRPTGSKQVQCGCGFVVACHMAKASCDFDFVKLQGAHGVVVSHPLRMREAPGSIPSVSTSTHGRGQPLVFGPTLAWTLSRYLYCMG